MVWDQLLFCHSWLLRHHIGGSQLCQKKDLLVTGGADCRLPDQKWWIMLASGWGSWADSSTLCVSVWVCVRRTQRQLYMKRQTPLLLNSFLPFFSTLPFPWQRKRRLTPGRRRWPWSPFLEWGEDGRGREKPHLHEHLSVINFPAVTFMVARTRAALPLLPPPLGDKEPRERQKDGPTAVCRCRFLFCLLGSCFHWHTVYIWGLSFTHQFCWLLRLRKSGVGTLEVSTPQWAVCSSSWVTVMLFV